MKDRRETGGNLRIVEFSLFHDWGRCCRACEASCRWLRSGRQWGSHGSESPMKRRYDALGHLRLSLMYEDLYRAERRWRTIGIADGLVLIVVHTLSEDNQGPYWGMGRIISAPKAERHERRAYKEEHV